MRKLIIVFIISGFTLAAYGQVGVAINTDGSDPDASAILDVSSTSQGMLVPRMNTTQWNSIASPATGLLVYVTDSSAFYYYDGAEWEKVANQYQLGGSTDYAEFESDGTLVFYGEATTFEDLQVPGLAVATKSNENPPELTAFTSNVELYSFSSETQANEEQVFFTVQIPHAWREGSTIYPHVHFSAITAGAAGDSVTWGLEYSWSSVNEAFSGTTTTITATEEISTISRTHQVIGFPGGIDGTGKKISSILVCRLFRNSSDAGDTFTDPVFLLAFDVHYEVNTAGSRDQWIK